MLFSLQLISQQVGGRSPTLSSGPALRQFSDLRNRQWQLKQGSAGTSPGLANQRRCMRDLAWAKGVKRGCLCKYGLSVPITRAFPGSVLVHCFLPHSRDVECISSEGSTRSEATQRISLTQVEMA